MSLSCNFQLEHDLDHDCILLGCSSNVLGDCGIGEDVAIGRLGFSQAPSTSDAEGANKLHEVLPNLGEDLHRRGDGGGRKQETAMCRLRVGHTWLTQSYLLKNEEQPFCYACDSLYTVRHILIECPDFQDTRRKYYSVTDLFRLFREVNPSRIAGYLKDLGVYGKI
ncbi:ribonuclease hi [Plakobranchus ocellatus]|uniref:Ribonuclease hi n=1 Tax=Plakobranchus ocellatus TaxID=259542 RepID=A0AAV4BAB7_9GAST|nr:ribonuclease hi [Plakobranchus ocellatus]